MENGTEFTAKKMAFILIGIAAGIAAFMLLKNAPMPPRIVGGVFVMVIFYWLTEVFPLYVTALLGPFLIALILGPLGRFIGIQPYDYTVFVYPFASPVIVLLLGGFFMARVFSKYHLDAEFSQFFIKKFGNKPKYILLGFMALTAFMSMWMSNTASTAIMVTAVLPIITGLPKGEKFTRAMMLGIPFAANIGGIATPIGTPPNAIAIGMLADHGVKVTFFKWMIVSFPPMIILLLFSWLLLNMFFRSGVKSLELPTSDSASPKASHRKAIYGTIAVTILLWLTDSIHGISSSLIALVPLLVFTIIGLGNKRTFKDISWEVLFLVGGGISMGVAVSKTGLSEILVGYLNLGHISVLWLGLAVSFAAALMGTFMSHTASANLLIPIAVSLGAMNPSFMVISAAVCASYGMALPISTPPNAIAYGSELISVKDMLKTGAVITLAGVLLTVFYQYYLLSWLYP